MSNDWEYDNSLIRQLVEYDNRLQEDLFVCRLSKR